MNSLKILQWNSNGIHKNKTNLKTMQQKIKLISFCYAKPNSPLILNTKYATSIRTEMTSLLSENHTPMVRRRFLCIVKLLTNTSN